MQGLSSTLTVSGMVKNLESLTGSLTNFATNLLVRKSALNLHTVQRWVSEAGKRRVIIELTAANGTWPSVCILSM